MKKEEVIRWAMISDDRVYRYQLSRRWDAEPPQKAVLFIGLNPSTADEHTDDPTIRRCISFAKSWGCNMLIMANLFAFRATNPKDMKAQEGPEGPLNEKYLLESARTADIIVAAWGANGGHRGQDKKVCDLLSFAGYKLQCLGTTKAGHPKHPLYLRKDTPLVPFVLEQGEQKRLEGQDGDR